MIKIIFLVIMLQFLGLVANAEYQEWVVTSMTTSTIVWNDRDAHGCIGSAWYIWSISKEKCIRTWEEDILSIDDRVDYDSINNSLSTEYKAKANAILEKYKLILWKYSETRQKSINEKMVFELDKVISNFVLRYPSDSELPSKAYDVYLTLKLLKYEFMSIK